MAIQNLQDWYAEMKEVHDQLKTFKNTLKDYTELVGITKANLMSEGLTEDKADYEINRRDKAVEVYNALIDFDNASN